jgi:hypothetical protein
LYFRTIRPGWRINYFFIDKELLARLENALFIRKVFFLSFIALFYPTVPFFTGQPMAEELADMDP